MKILELKNAEKPGRLYIHCNQILWFRNNNDTNLTRSELHLADGSTIYVKEVAEGLAKLMGCEQ